MKIGLRIALKDDVKAKSAFLIFREAIEAIKRGAQEENVHYSVQDLTFGTITQEDGFYECLIYADNKMEPVVEKVE